MKGKFTHIESKGLPGGPNEMFTYTTGVFSVKGYKRDSPDVNNPFNIIPSGNITMKDVDFPVLGTDNLGNSKVMMPGNDYKFPGDMVFETPMAQEGGGVNKEGVKQYRWFKNYMRSPKYKERLKKEFPDYNDRQIEQEAKSRLQNVMQTRIGFLPYSSEFSKNIGGIQGFYDDDAYPGAIMLRPEYSASTSDEIFEPGHYLSPYKTIPLHEWSHAADDGGKRIPQSTTDLMLSKMKENFFGAPKLQYYYTKPTEYLGRMQPLRYLMQEEGLYDAGTQDFTKEHLEKAKQNQTIKNNQHFIDLMEHVKSDEDFIELMNKVAFVNQKNNSITMKAQFGGMTRRKVDKVLDQNKNLNFVQRMYQENTPSMIIPGQDAPSTHFMESADNIVYPTVVQMPDGTLQYLGDDAYNYAVESGEYIEFPNPRQARRFGKSYKKGTGVLKQKDGAQRGKEITPYESWENAKAVYDPVYNKVAKAYGYDPESSSTLEKLLNDERIDKYVRSGIEEAYGYSIDDFEFGRRRVPPLEGGIKDFQKLILNASDEELRNLLKKDYSDIGLTNFKSYLPEQLSYWDALKYMKKFYDYINEGYTFQEGGGVARESTAVNMPMMLPDNFDPGPVVPPTVAEVKGLKPTSSGEIRASEAPSRAKKVMNRAANPMSAFKYFATGEQAPEMIPDKEVPLDYAMDVINPFAWLDYATKAGRDIREGDYVGAAFNALGATPVIPATAKPVSNIAKQAVPKVKAAVPKIVLNKPYNRYKVNTPEVQVPRQISGNPVDFSDIQITREAEKFNPTSINYIDYKKAENFVKNISTGADDFDNLIQSRIRDLESREGLVRLMDQEADYLRTLPGFPEYRIDQQALKNAKARIQELKEITTTNRKAANTLQTSSRDVNNIEPFEQFLNNPNLYDNASYSIPRGIKDDVWTGDVYGTYMPEIDEKFLSFMPQYGAKVLPGDLSLGAPFLKSRPTMAHEVGHALQRGRALPIDKQARDLLKPRANLTPEEARAYDYFTKGSRRKEPSAFLNELRESMLERGLINSRYDEITPELLQDAYASFGKKPSGMFIENAKDSSENIGRYLSSTRIFDFMEPSSQNFKNLSSLLNKLPATTIGLGAGAAAMNYNQPIKQEGGETDSKFLQNEVVERFATGDKLPYKPGKGPTRPNKYTVQTGDTLYGIARKKDTSVKDLESWNKDLEPNKLKAGQIINLPTGSPDVPMGITSELLRRQAFKESSFDPNAISKSGYKGLGQIGDAVISDYLKRNKLEGEIDPFDPKQNSDVQKWYMDQLYNAAFIKKGNPSDKVRVAKALAAYNAGPGTLLEVLEDQKKKGVDIYNSLDWLQAMPKEETRGYIKAILLGEDEKFEKWYDDAKKNPENKKYLDLFNKAQDGAEITLMDLYKGYIYDQFTDKAMQQKAKNAYDKLNRVYYRDAKAAGMSVPNYIMTNMNKL